MAKFPGTPGVDAFDPATLPLDGTESVLLGQSGVTVQTLLQNILDLANPALLNASFTINAVTASTAITTIDLANGHQIELFLTASTKLNIINPPLAGQKYQIPFKVKQNAIGGWSLNALWQVNGTDVTPIYPQNTPPALTGSANSVDDLHIQISNIGGVYSIVVSKALDDLI